MVLIICRKNESNLTNRYVDMVPNGQKVRTNGMDKRTDNAQTISLRLHQGDKKIGRGPLGDATYQISRL